MRLLLFFHHSTTAECFKPCSAISIATAESGQKVAPFRGVKIISHRYFSSERQFVVPPLGGNVCRNGMNLWRTLPPRGGTTYSAFAFAAAACGAPKTVFQSFLMFTTVKPYCFAALSEALSFSP